MHDYRELILANRDVAPVPERYGRIGTEIRNLSDNLKEVCHFECIETYTLQGQTEVSIVNDVPFLVWDWRWVEMIALPIAMTNTVFAGDALVAGPVGVILALHASIELGDTRSVATLIKELDGFHLCDAKKLVEWFNHAYSEKYNAVYDQISYCAQIAFLHEFAHIAYEVGTELPDEKRHLRVQFPSGLDLAPARSLAEGLLQARDFDPRPKYGDVDSLTKLISECFSDSLFREELACDLFAMEYLFEGKEGAEYSARTIGTKGREMWMFFMVFNMMADLYDKFALRRAISNSKISRLSDERWLRFKIARSRFQELSFCAAFGDNFHRLKRNLDCLLEDSANLENPEERGKIEAEVARRMAELQAEMEKSPEDAVQYIALIAMLEEADKAFVWDARYQLGFVTKQYLNVPEGRFIGEKLNKYRASLSRLSPAEQKKQRAEVSARIGWPGVSYFC